MTLSISASVWQTCGQTQNSQPPMGVKIPSSLASVSCLCSKWWQEKKTTTVQMANSMTSLPVISVLSRNHWKCYGFTIQFPVIRRKSLHHFQVFSKSNITWSLRAMPCSRLLASYWLPGCVIITLVVIPRELQVPPGGQQPYAPQPSRLCCNPPPKQCDACLEKLGERQGNPWEVHRRTMML